jgi:hypothetical protein
MVDLKAEVKRTPRRAPAPREYDPEYDQYMHMTGFYVIVHDAMRQQSWRAAGLRPTGRVRAPTISYVPPPCAMMFLNDLCETLSVDYRVIDKRGATGASSARGVSPGESAGRSFSQWPTFRRPIVDGIVCVVYSIR